MKFSFRFNRQIHSKNKYPEVNMNTKKTLSFLSILIAILALIAAGIGVFAQGKGEPFPFTTLRGETVMMHGRGIYQYESVSGAAQVMGGDMVTLFIGIPLLLVAVLLVWRDSLRGRLLLTGTLGYFLYTYTSIVFLAAYNPLFLLYVVLFSLSLFAFVLAMASIDLKHLPEYFVRPVPRKTIAGFLFLIAAFLLLNWVGRIILPSLTSGEPPANLESYTTLVIQALDLGVIVPAAILTGILLLQRKALGYLLASVVLIKGMTMAAAITAMIVMMSRAGVVVTPAEAVIFPAITLVSAGLTYAVLRSIKENPTEPAGRGAAALA
jgi:hypothetical protein